jgi:hypothetical protein
MQNQKCSKTSSTREINYKHRTYSLLRVPVVFHKSSKFALIDTGACASFISDEYLASLPEEAVVKTIESNNERVFRSASGESMKITAVYEIKIKLSPECEVNQIFYVLPKLEEECILGIDFLHNNKISKDVFNKEMLLGTRHEGKVIKLNRISKKTFPLHRIVDQPPLLDFDIKHITEKPLYTKMLNLLMSYITLFATKLLDLGQTSAIKHHIETNGETIVLHPYKTPFVHRPLLKKTLDNMLEGKIIERSTSAFRSPHLMVGKKGGDMRLCHDYRELNKITTKIRYPLPLIENILHLLSGAKYFTTLDLFSGFWQIEIAECDRHKTAFSCEFGHFQYIRMPFGLCNAPSTFQNAMEIILQPILNTFVMVYIDDIIIFSKDLNDHIAHLKQVFNLLQKAGMKVKVQKCRFARQEVEYLGHIVSQKGIKADPKKLNSVRNFPTPRNLDELRSFLGLANYYRRFIDQFATKIHVLLQLTKSKITWKWGPEEQTCFDSIKELLCTAPVLAYPDFSRKFIIHTDACGYGVGGVLSQMPSPQETQCAQEDSLNESREHPIAYTSKHLTELQSKWCTTEKEAFAIIHTVKAFFPYLYGNVFTIVTDHAALQYMMSKRESTGRLTRWALYLQQFEMEIKYRPGKSHQNADALSRTPILVVMSNSFMVDDWLIAQHEDPFCQTVMTDRSKQKDRVKFSQEDEFKILPSGLLATSRGEIVVPAKLRKEILERFHDHKLAGHQGVQKTLTIIKNKYFWPKMAQDVRIHIINCLICARRKVAGTCRAPLQPIPIAEYVWQRMAMDIVGPVPVSNKGNTNILVMIEYVTRYVIAVPLKNTKAPTIMRKFIKHVINTEGIPSEILTDQGKNFQSIAMEELCKQLGIKQLRTTAYHPQTDGAVERVNRTIGDMLTAHVYNNPREWDEHLNYVVAAYNRTPHSSTGESPFFLLKGRDALEPTDLRPPMRNRVLTDQNNVFTQQWQEAIELAKSKVVLAQARQKKYYDRSVKDCSFKENDIVFLKIMAVQTGKFYMRWDGPFIIVKKLSELNYNISHLEDNYQIVVHVNRLRKWNGDPKSLKDKAVSMENMEPAISPDVNNEITVPTVTQNNSENENLNKKQSESESESENEKSENEITVDIHVPNPLPTNIEENTIPQQLVETTVSETETAISDQPVNNTPTAIVEQPQTQTVQKTRKVGRPRKNQRPPKPDIQPSTHKFTLRRTTKLPNRY